MTRRILFLTLLMLGRAMCATDIAHTNSFLNGNSWVIMPDTMKVGYLFGAWDGYKLAVANVPIDPKVKDKASLANEPIPENLSPNDMVMQLDGFYKEPKNLLIPIVNAILIIAHRASGSSEMLVGAEIDVQRKLAQDAQKTSTKQPISK